MRSLIYKIFRSLMIITLAIGGCGESGEEPLAEEDSGNEVDYASEEDYGSEPDYEPEADYDPEIGYEPEDEDIEPDYEPDIYSE